MPYCTEQKVFDACGWKTEKVQSVTGKSGAEVTSLITDYIAWGEKTIKEWVRIPIVERMELHVGDGEKFEFDLGPEDEEFAADYNPLNDVNKVYAAYMYNKRVKLPYPKADCELGTENESNLWAVSNATANDEGNIVAAGSYAIEATFTAAGYIRYPTTEDLNKNINVFGWVAFRFRTNDATKTFQVKLYDRSGNTNTYGFTVYKADAWFIIMIKIDDFDGSISWDQENLYYLDIYASGACTIYVDNLNFNDGLFWTIPQGKLVYSCAQKPTYTYKSAPSDGYEFYVTYDFDPFNTTIPKNIEEACACLAGVKLLDHLLGYRTQDSAFILDAEDGTIRADKLSLEITRSRILKRAKELVGQYGYGFDSGTA